MRLPKWQITVFGEGKGTAPRRVWSSATIEAADHQTAAVEGALQLEARLGARVSVMPSGGDEETRDGCVYVVCGTSKLKQGVAAALSPLH